MVQTRACDACYRRKIQCSILNASEPCNWCSHHGLVCTFNREVQTTRRKRAKLSDVQELHSRIEQLERALAQSQARLEPTSDGSLCPEPLMAAPLDRDASSQRGSSTIPGSEPSTSEPTEFHIISPQSNFPLTHLGLDIGLESHFGQNWYYKGTPVFSEKGQKWVSSKTGEIVTWSELKLLSRRQPFFASALQPPSSHQELLQLPPEQTLRSCLGSFFRSSFLYLFPVLDNALFEETIRMAYQPLDSPTFLQSHVSARICVLAVVSIMCQLEETKRYLIGVDGNMCANRAHYFLGHVTGHLSLVDLQAVLMLQRYRSSTSQTGDAIILHAVACRIACGLRGHTDESLKTYSPDGSLARRQAHHARLLFWLCYMLDKDISLHSGQPPLLTEEYCDLASAEHLMSYSSYSLESDGRPSTHHLTCEKTLLHMPGDPRLSLLKERAYRFLFSPRSFKTTESQLILHIRQLDSDLESWRLSIPIDFRPKLSITSNHNLSANEIEKPQRIRCLSLQLEYHYLLTVIHTTVRRCGADSLATGDLPEDLHTVMHSSADLSLEASRSTLMVLNSSTAAYSAEAFCGRVFYAIVASISLFLNILLHPLSTEATLDLKVIKAAIDLVHNMSTHATGYNASEYTGKVTEFILELARLGGLAISKAKEEEKY